MGGAWGLYESCMSDACPKVAMKIEHIESAEMEKPDPPHVGLAEGNTGVTWGFAKRAAWMEGMLVVLIVQLD